MAIDNELWIPEEYGGAMVQLYQNESAIMRGSTRLEPMQTDTKHVPKDAAVDMGIVPKGTAYGLDAGVAAEVLLTAIKHAVAVPVADEDIADAAGFVSIIDNKKMGAASAAATLMDNSTCAVTGAANGTTIPYTSVYRAVSQYASGANIFTIESKAGSSATPAQVRTAVMSAIEVAETSDWTTADLGILASPSFKSWFRNQPVDGADGIPIVNDIQLPTLGGYSIFYGRGLRLSATATKAPSGAGGVKGTAGNPILVIGPRSHLIVGNRTGFETQFLDGNTGVGALSDTAYLKARHRKGFAVGDASAFAIIEIIKTP